MAIKVRAVFPGESLHEFGFYGNKRRKNGDVFTIDDESHFSEKWMVRLGKPKAKKRDEKGV